jgi:hypothetical protein
VAFHRKIVAAFHLVLHQEDEKGGAQILVEQMKGEAVRQKEQ